MFQLAWKATHYDKTIPNRLMDVQVLVLDLYEIDVKEGIGHQKALACCEEDVVLLDLVRDAL